MATSKIPCEEYRDSYNIPTYGGTVYCKRSGNVVNIVVRDLGSSVHIPQGQDVVISVGIADKYKPKEQITVNGQVNGNISGAASVLYYIRTNGEVVTYSYDEISSGNANFTFIV